MNAEGIARALGGRRAGAAWMARCPAHDDREPSLSIKNTKDGRVLVRCHAGCAQERVITELNARGLWRHNSRKPRSNGSDRIAATIVPVDRDERDRTQAALRIWATTAPAAGTLVETYLRTRGITVPIPAALRFQSESKHPGGNRWPAMIALITRGTDAVPLAIHRTFLARDGSGKAPIEPQKMMLGPCRGGAVQLAPVSECLMIGEGIETSLAAMQATGMPAWAALSTSGLRTLDLPPHVREVIVLADGDPPGEAASRDAAFRWMREGRHVRIARPPQGYDFNDMLIGRATTPAEVVA
jgi:hypothetical protein